MPTYTVDVYLKNGKVIKFSNIPEDQLYGIQDSAMKGSGLGAFVDGSESIYFTPGSILYVATRRANNEN